MSKSLSLKEFNNDTDIRLEAKIIIGVFMLFFQFPGSRKRKRDCNDDVLEQAKIAQNQVRHHVITRQRQEGHFIRDLYDAIKQGSPLPPDERLQCLIGIGAEEYLKHGYWETPMQLAIHIGNLDAVKCLFQAGLRDLTSEATPLHVAATYGQYDIAKFFIETFRNSDLHKNVTNLIELEDRQGRTPLIIAVNAIKREISFQAENVEALIARKYMVANLLLKNGANVHAVDCYEQTPLHIAVISGNIQFVNLILEFGDTTKAVDRDGDTPLDYANKYGYKDIQQRLHSLKLANDSPVEDKAYEADEDIEMCSSVDVSASVEKDNSQNATRKFRT